ncbi:VacJ family lipoprotein [Sulfurospirillum sp. T05]|uniref:VacJ family lipoprotein n=1 Tax=Sulfurospirillum tamanense TaxID=2813362 RepID=A0ABS2WNQ0_9BACT|nr:VacJ family lipoprotein [Sulfurospirillum tamanensis]
MKKLTSFLAGLVLFFFATTTLVYASDQSEFDEEFAIISKNDPLEGYNRAMTQFNDNLYVYALIPVAKGYATVAPEPLREGISNLFYNLLFPVRFINALLQGEATKSADELFRFVINSTAGVGGFFEVAGTHLDIPTHAEDFGQTLGTYGLNSGPHVVWPFLGPSNVRDTFGMAGDWLVSPMTYIKTDTDALAIKGFYRLNELSQTYPQYETLRKDALDLYPYLRDLYEARREKLIQE